MASGPRPGYMWVLNVLVLAAGSYALAVSSWYFLNYGWKPYRVETAWIAVGLFSCLALITRRDGAESQARPSADSRALAVVAAAYVGVAFALYWRALSIGLLSDDFVILDRAVSSNVFWPPGGPFYRPLPLLIWHLVAQVTPGSVALTLHVVSVALHAVAAILVMRVAAAVGFERLEAAIAGFLFLVFPGSVEAVAWCAGLPDVLMTVLALWIVLLALARPASSVIPLAVLSAAALLSKETGVIVPMIGLVIAAVRGQTRRANRRLLLPVCLGLAYAALRASFAPPEFLTPPTRYFVKELLKRLFGGLALPWTARELAAAPAIGIATAALVVAAVVQLTVSRSRVSGGMKSLVLALIVWIVLAVLPVYSMFFVTSDLQGSRYLYLASTAWVILLTCAVASATDPFRGPARAATLLLALSWLYGSVVHLTPWREAALTRDLVLGQATAAMTRYHCASATAVGVPDSIEGAYVFRNGFEQALRLTPVVGDPAAGSCELRWSSGAFELAALRKEPK